MLTAFLPLRLLVYCEAAEVMCLSGQERDRAESAGFAVLEHKIHSSIVPC